MVEAGRTATGRNSDTTGDAALPVAAMLREEFAALHPEAVAPADASLRQIFAAIHALPYDQAALCLSGGGIRSASFALGVLQELARRGLLARFHYLSTVSGGGYIGGWLSAWRHHAQDDDGVFRRLHAREAGPRGAGAENPFAEAPEIEGVRQNSNFLTPKLGAMSADTWTVAALCGRNLLLNWTVFGPLLLAVVLVPHCSAMFLGWAQGWSGWTVPVTGAFAALLLVLALAVMTGNRPLHRRDGAKRSGWWPAPFGRRAFDTNAFHHWVLLPVYGAATLLAVLTAQAIQEGGRFEPLNLVIGAVFGAMIYAASWLIAFAARQVRPFLQNASAGGGEVSALQELLYWAIAGSAAGLMTTIGMELYRFLAPHGWEWQTLSACGIAWVMSSLLIADLLFTGLTSYERNSDLDREWSARAAGWLGVAGLFWLVLAGVVLFGPFVLDRVGHAILVSVGGVSGLVTLALGSSAKTAADGARLWMERLSLSRILGIATLIFVLCLATLLSYWSGRALPYLETHLALVAPQSRLLVAIVATLVCAGIGIGASYFVNVNRFSLHDVYRNRLIRAFLGSARSLAERNDPRATDPFTGFSRGDNLPMSSLREAIPRTTGQGRLFHVVNMTLNLVGGANLAWQERKADSFSATPLHAGNPTVGYRPSAHYGGSYGGVSLGTAMAISGAAVSPNQGYHSSPLVGFLMMLFNVRLGWWLGNPASRPSIWRRDGPRWGFLPELREMFGLTDDRSDWIYLSDGGHFENLGIYEMVRRRCHFILASDAGCDPDCALADLGNAVRKIWIDLGVRIEFASLDVRARQQPPVDGVYCGEARIIYPEAPDRPGTLIYFKPGYHGTEPADVRAYAMAQPAFPHETTADQWFTESQMESYRALGAHILDTMCRGRGGQVDEGGDLSNLAALKRRVSDYISVTRGGTAAAPPT